MFSLRLIFNAFCLIVGTESNFGSNPGGMATIAKKDGDDEFKVDGKTYKVPIVTDLPGGKNYYCIYRPPPTACASRNDWDERCEWDQTYHPNRFQ